MTGAMDPLNAVLEVTYDQITTTAPGELPVLDFTVKVNGAAHDILTTPLERLRFTIAGPSTDIKQYYQVRAQGSGAEGTITALDAAAGQFRYTSSPRPSRPAPRARTELQPRPATAAATPSTRSCTSPSPTPAP